MPKNNEWTVDIDEKELDKMIARGKALYDDYVKDKPIATRYLFDPVSRAISIRIDDGSRIDFPVSRIRELGNATDEEIQQGYITKAGDAIHWDDLDAHYTVAGLAANIFGTREWMRELGRRGGERTSPVKVAAARMNGLKGGRPRKSQNIADASLERRGRFELIMSQAGKFRFNLKASNGQVILTSEAYETKEAAIKGISIVKRNAARDKHFERKMTKDGSVYFVLKAANGEKLGKSETYRTKRGMESGIKSVKIGASKADVKAKS